MTPEDRFKEYFPDKDIHSAAYEEILLFDRSKYDKKEGARYLNCEIPVRQIVGTIGKNAGKGYRWADILVIGKKFDYSQWRPENIKQILAFKSADIFFYKDADHGEYYIHSEGHHRVAFWKCLGIEKIAAQVQDFHLLNQEDNAMFNRQILQEKPPVLKRLTAFLHRLINVRKRADFL